MTSQFHPTHSQTCSGRCVGLAFRTLTFSCSVFKGVTGKSTHFHLSASLSIASYPSTSNHGTHAVVLIMNLLVLVSSQLWWRAFALMSVADNLEGYNYLPWPHTGRTTNFFNFLRQLFGDCGVHDRHAVVSAISL